MTNSRVDYSTSPTVARPDPAGLTSALARNIEALRRRRADEERTATASERLAGAITAFTGSMTFAALHLAVFGFWIVANLGWVPAVRPWDESFVVLAMIASVEAIFLSTFVLISQNRMAAAADKRADLDLQINLLAEHEVTKVVAMVATISRHLGLDHAVGDETAELERNVAPEAVLDAIDRADTSS